MEFVTTGAGEGGGLASGGRCSYTAWGLGCDGVQADGFGWHPGHPARLTVFLAEAR